MIHKIIPTDFDTYFLENRVSKYSGIGRIANELLFYLNSKNYNFNCSKNSIFKSVHQFSPINLFFLLINPKSS